MSIFNNIFQAPVPVEVLKHGLPLLDVGKEPSKLIHVNRSSLVRVEHVDHGPENCCSILDSGFADHSNSGLTIASAIKSVQFSHFHSS